MPLLEGLRDRYEEKGLLLVGVSLDRGEEDAKGYLQQHGYHKLVALWESPTAASQVARLYSVFGIPRTFVIDRDGIIRYAGHPSHLTAAMIEPWL